MPPKVDTKHSNEYSQRSPLEPSTTVKETWAAWNAGSQLSDVERAKIQSASTDVVKVVYDFGKEIAPNTYEAAHLVSLMDEFANFNGFRSEFALENLEEHVSKKDEHRHGKQLENGEYVLPYTSDIQKINSFLDHHWEKMSEGATDSSTDEPIERQYTNPWTTRNKTIPLRDVFELVSDRPSDIVLNPEGVNIESILIGAGLVYNTLRNAGTVSEDQLLRAVYDADTFYKPLLEIIGYDGFVSALKREAILIRMSRNAGEYDGITQESLELARGMLRELPPAPKMARIIDNLVSELTLKDVNSKSVLRDTSGHGMQFGTGHISEDDMLDFEDTLPGPVFEAIRYTWRVKTDTESARKIAKQIENQKKQGAKHIVVKPVYDIVGVTVIVPSLDSLSDLFRLAVSRTIDAKSLQPIHTPERPTTAFHAKGDDVIQAVDIDFGDISGGEVLDTKLSNNKHKVAKITLQYTPEGYDYPIPFEVQFQTKEQRVDSRIGPAAHTFKEEGYKVPGLEDLKVLKLLSSLSKRRRTTGTGGPTDLSKERAKKLYVNQKIKKALGALAQERGTLEP
jgi:hypothetical protein